LSLIKYPDYLSKNYIEQEVEKVFERMYSSPQFTPAFPLDPNRVAEFLGLDIVWDTLETDSQGQIFARILPVDRLIEINDSIPALRESAGLESSTIAHEIGHWVLHVNHDELSGVSTQLSLGFQKEEDGKPFLCRSMTRLEGVEWQAQYFASCLLMPYRKLKESGKGRKLTSWPHLYSLAEDFGVTISNLIYRLQDLGWIHIPQGSKQIYLGKTVLDRHKNPFK
jgi:hypothetical protein